MLELRRRHHRRHGRGDQHTAGKPTAETERRLLASLREAARTRAVIVIAHRLSSVRAADLILFLRDGHVAERGNHEELMARPGGSYRRFVELQTGSAS